MTEGARASVRTLLGLLLLLVAGPALAQPPQKVTPDGGRATAVHRIPLYHAEGEKIGLDDDPLLPFSTRHTCGQCHDYETIARGHHFNAGKPPPGDSIAGGYPGEPWILYDGTTGTQVPISYRGRYSPDEAGLTPWNFVRAFGAFLPGGGKSEPANPVAEKGARWFATGKLEINCLHCHNASRAQNGSEWAKQISKQNFLWAAAASSDIAVVEGSVARVPDSFDPFMETNAETKGPKIFYDRSRFNARGEVFFDIVRRPESSRCYFCHTTRHLGPGVEKSWNTDRDVHLVRGMQCTDCHRNGLDHKIVRGYEDEGWVPWREESRSLTCRGCHLGEGQRPGGRLAAPVPKHLGLPPVHFEKLSCTACHSGSRPGAKALRAQTSASHRIGVHGGYRGEDSPPFVLSPVLARRIGFKIMPYKAIWPAFWGVRIDEVEGEHAEYVKPISHFRVREIARDILDVTPEPDPSAKHGEEPDAKPVPPKSSLTRAKVRAVLTRLAAVDLGGAPIYVSGGRLYRLDASGALTTMAHESAEPSMWPLAHDVRPASQALGAGGCTDCHAPGAPIFFGKVTALAPAAIDTPLTFEMHEFQRTDPEFVNTLVTSFAGRPWFQAIGFIASAVIALVLAVLLFNATGHWLRRPAPVTRIRSRFVGLAVLAASVLVLAVTGLETWWFGENGLFGPVIFSWAPRELQPRLTGIWLILHCAAGLILVIGLACRAVTWTARGESAASRRRFWLMLALGFGAAVTALGGMTGLLDPSEIDDWIGVHRWVALLATGAILVYVYRSARHLWRARREQPTDGEA